MAAVVAIVLGGVAIVAVLAVASFPLCAGSDQGKEAIRAEADHFSDTAGSVGLELGEPTISFRSSRCLYSGDLYSARYRYDISASDEPMLRTAFHEGGYVS